jgi:hypothetical protein
MHWSKERTAVCSVFLEPSHIEVPESYFRIQMLLRGFLLISQSEMRFLTLLLSGLGTLGLAIAQSNNNGVQYKVPDLTKLPACGLLCLAKVAPVAGCGLTDYGCMCHNQKFIDMATKCTLANCTVEQSFGKFSRSKF